MPTLSDRPAFAERPAPAESSSRALALEEALTRFGAPEIFNSDQGAQFTDSNFTERLKAHGVAISMDGKRRRIDNVFIERLWRTVKYEEVYLKAYASQRRQNQGVNNVQRAILAQWRSPYGVRCSDILRVRGRVLLSSVRERWIRGRCRDAEWRYAYDWVSHLGPIYLGTIIYVVGAVVALIGLSQATPGTVQAAR